MTFEFAKRNILSLVCAYMDHSTHQRYIEGDMRRLEEMLAQVAQSDAELQRKIVGGEDVQLLDLACGACDEAKTLARFFGGKESGAGKGRNMKFVGFDVRDREIADATARFENDPDADFEFIRGDATKLGDYRELPGAFDVIFMRHQNLWNGKRTWEEIYRNALEKLSPNGRLIITSYFDREHMQAIDAIKNQGGELLVTKANEISRELPTPGKSIDRHVAVLKREG